MTALAMPDDKTIYYRDEDVVIFNQLARKIPMDGVSNAEYYRWLDSVTDAISVAIPGAKIAEKPAARERPPLNTAIYYDTEDRAILPTGALLRTSCNQITHAFCAFKMKEDAGSVRKDYRHVFEGQEKRTIQQDPDSPEAVQIVQRLMRRTDIEHPGMFLRRHYGIEPAALTPSIRLDSLRYTFFAWLDGRDALRCSIDRYTTVDLRRLEPSRTPPEVVEVELAIYPRITPEVAKDPRAVDLISYLSDSLCRTFGTRVSADIKYQRCAQALDIAY